MRCPSARSLVAAVSLAAAVPASAAVTVMHEPVACVPADRYQRISATAGRAGEVAGAELQFRVDGGEWYGVGMIAEGATWSADLPRPTARVPRLEYRIVMTGPDSATATSGPHAVPVSADCAAAHATVDVASPILVRVPPGAPLVPPVPVGFSPAGVLIANAPAPPPPSKKKGAAWIAGGAAIAAGAVAATRSAPAAEPSTVPAFEYFSFFITPSSVNTITLGVSSVSAVVTVRGGPRAPSTVAWRLELLRGGDECAFTAGVAALAETRPLGVFLTAPVQTSGACGPSFEVQNGRLTIVFEGQMVFDRTLPMAFRVVTP